jgi:hypothetical protein
VWVGPLSGDGIYHGRVILLRNYPAQPPRIQVWTPSGRFVPRADICLSASSYHPESWSASWSTRTLVEALRLHMITPAQEIGGLDESDEQRLDRMTASRSWRGRVSSSILVDHARMVAQGLFPAPTVVANENDDPTESEPQEGASSTIGETKANVELAPQHTPSQQKRRRQQQPGSGRHATATIPRRSEAETTLPVVPSLLMSLHRLLLSPVRLMLLGFAILFFVLNQS